MTCIAGLVHNGRVYIGADSAGIGGWDLTIRADEKAFTTGPYVMGFTDSFRMGQLLRYSLTPPEPTEDLQRFMVTAFVDAVRGCLKAGGYARKENEQESGGAFLVGVRGSLFVVCGDYQVAEPADQMAAVGCGAQVALGALYATQWSPEPGNRLDTALRAAERLSAGVRGPFTIVREPDRVEGKG